MRWFLALESAEPLTKRLELSIHLALRVLYQAERSEQCVGGRLQAALRLVEGVLPRLGRARARGRGRAAVVPTWRPRRVTSRRGLVDALGGRLQAGGLQAERILEEALRRELALPRRLVAVNGVCEREVREGRGVVR